MHVYEIIDKAYYFKIKFSFVQSESEGINKLRRGSLILVLASILIIGAFLVLLLSLIAVVQSPTTSSITSSIISILVAFIIAEIIGDIGGIIGMLNVRKGFEILESFGRDVGIGYTGTTLAFIAIGLSILGSLLTFVGGETLVAASNIIEFIANVLIGIGFYKVGEIYNEDTTKLGGILIIIIPFIGYILTYSGLGKIKTMALPPSSPSYFQTQPTQTNYPPQIYQVGQGIIRGNGYAQISLYSSTQATIVSARIDGTGLSSVNVNPVVLQPGQNEVTIQFNNVSSLTPGSNYIITLVVNVGGNISEVKVTAVYQP